MTDQQKIEALEADLLATTARLNMMRESCMKLQHMADYWRGMYEAAAGVVDECVEEATGT